MTDIIKVKTKKAFEWNKHNKYIFLKVTMLSHTTIRNIQIFLSDLILRITNIHTKISLNCRFLKINWLSFPENKYVLMYIA